MNVFGVDQFGSHVAGVEWFARRFVAVGAGPSFGPRQTAVWVSADGRGWERLALPASVAADSRIDALAQWRGTLIAMLRSPRILIY